MVVVVVVAVAVAVALAADLVPVQITSKRRCSRTEPSLNMLANSQQHCSGPSVPDISQGRLPNRSTVSAVATLPPPHGPCIILREPDGERETMGLREIASHATHLTDGREV